jgi:DNA-directed RNA polymerase specialized sigma24 family protein
MSNEDRFEEALDLADRLDRALIHYDPVQYALITAFYELKQAAPRQYSIFVLRHIKGMAVPQICKALGVSRHVVDQNLSRARSALRRTLCRYPEIQTWLRATGRIETTTGSGGADQGISE